MAESDEQLVERVLGPMARRLRDKRVRALQIRAAALQTLDGLELLAAESLPLSAGDADFEAAARAAAGLLGVLRQDINYIELSPQRDEPLRFTVRAMLSAAPWSATRQDVAAVELARRWPA